MKSIAECLEAAGMQRAPFGAVSISDADGLYFNESAVDRSIQIISIGPMTRSPVQVAHLVNNFTVNARKGIDGADGYWVKDVGFIPPFRGRPVTKQLVIERGFVSIILACEADEKRPAEPFQEGTNAAASAQAA